MRDQAFIAEHRGGILTKEQHRQLVLWACMCVENTFHLLSLTIGNRLSDAIKVAKDWTEDNASVGDARKASVEAIAVANELNNPIEIAIARSVGHAVATAHMADHSLRAAEYAMKAIKLAGKVVEEERNWQVKKLPPEIADIVLTVKDGPVKLSYESANKRTSPRKTNIDCNC